MPLRRPRAPFLLWDEWAAAIISVRVDGAWVDLNGPGARRDLPLSPPLHVLTAHDPRGTVAGPERNDAAQAALVAEMVDGGLVWLEALGRSRDGSHAEASVALSGVALERARAIGRRYEQEALFEVWPDEVVVRSCWDSHERRSPRLDPAARGPEGGLPVR